MFVLLPSPLLGPATWRPVEAWLREHGHEATTVDYGPGPRTPASVMAAVLGAAAAASRPVVLVPHSNAGLYAPELARRLGASCTVYVDAALPDAVDEDSETSLAPGAFLDFLRGLTAEDGRLPPWTRWWPDIGALFPDARTRAAVEREQSRLPLAYFTTRVAVPARWSERPAAYLAFGETYADESRFAQDSAWPTLHLDGGHLHQLWAPADVGAAIVELGDAARQLRAPGPIGP